MQRQGEITIVTGAASGLGAATASRLAAEGATVALLDVNDDAVQARAEEVGGRGYKLDVSDAAAAEDVFARIEQELGPPAIAVNCAGIAPAGRIVGRDGPMSLDRFADVIRINLVGSFNIMRLAAAMMARREADAHGERGVIVNTASIAAFEGQIGQAAYAASKGGIASLTLPAARELAGRGIRVAAIAPGLFATPLLLGMPQNVQDSLAATVPFPQRFGDAEEFAALVAHICENRMINGEVIRLDGALRMAPR